ncbi:Hypothetical protein SRAE_0000051000 [Strongyloides ratti]|uniref:Uncharacterized protein n=1 Tax=Strongyloides ratti TaxID=34506 RepID=A0A090KV37_STRRB|nr:Hypothetical protein SRAE_0000051000 [Strongyloides ratti]CEF61385.1 Hypothetical protein SRAE_0000051000 [Strongyloides ratti]
MKKVYSWFSSDNTEKIAKTIKKITSEKMLSINNKISSLSDTFFLTLSGIKEKIDNKSKIIDKSHNLLVFIIMSITFISSVFFLKKRFSWLCKCFYCSRNQNLPYPTHYPFRGQVYNSRRGRLSVDRRNSYYDA